MAVVSVLHLGSELAGESLLSKVKLKNISVRVEEKIIYFVIADDVIVLQNFCPKFISTISPGQKLNLVRLPRRLMCEEKILSALFGLYIACGKIKIVDDEKNLIFTFETSFSLDLVKRDLSMINFSFLARKSKIQLDRKSTEILLSFPSLSVIDTKYFIKGQIDNDLTIINSEMNKFLLNKLSYEFKEKGERIKVKKRPRYHPDFLTSVVLDTKDVRSSGSFVFNSLIPSIESSRICLPVVG